VNTAAVVEQPGPDPAPAPARHRAWRRELASALIVAAALAVAGVPLGLLWRQVAPKVEFVMTDGGATTVAPEPEEFVAADGWYLLITFATGVLAAVVVWALLRRRRGPVVLLGLVAGCVAGGVLTAWVGHQIGYAHYRYLVSHAPVGTHFFRPPLVRTGYVGLWFGFLPRVQGAVLIEAIAAATTYLVLAAFHVEPDLRGRPGLVPGQPEPGGDLSSATPEWTGQREWPAPPGSGPGEPPPG
jgi:Protein of unknown function (DUF2567)